MRIYETVEIEDDEAWSSIFGSLSGADSPWIRNIEYTDGAWDRIGIVKITAEDAEGEEDRVEFFQRDDLHDVYQTAHDLHLTHCGGSPVASVDDPDACTADALLQIFMYGEIVYG